jgi:hypothetical protein
MRRPVDDKSPVAVAVARYVDQRETDRANRLGAFLWFSFATAAVLILACLRAI